MAAQPTDGAGAAGAPASEPSSTEPSRVAESDFKARAQSDPNFAWEQVRQFQARADRLQSAEDKYKQLVDKVGSGAIQYIEQFGGDVVSKAFENYVKLRNSESFGEVVQGFERTGELPARTGSGTKMEDDDEYKTPEEIEMDNLKREISTLKQSLGQTTLVQGKQALTRHMEKVFAEYAFAPEDADKIRKTVTSQFESWATMGPAGESAMRSVMADTPDSERTIRGMMLGAVTPEALRAAAQQADLRKRQGLRGLATDVPSSEHRSTGTEPPPVFKTAIEAALYARENPQAHTSE